MRGHVIMKKKKTIPVFHTCPFHYLRFYQRIFHNPGLYPSIVPNTGLYPAVFHNPEFNTCSLRLFNLGCIALNFIC